MKNKLLAMWIYFILINVQNVYSQDFLGKIKLGDSLFFNNQYAASNKIYESIYYQTGQYSLAMLLKMAFINEMNGDYSKALLFLNIYYHDQPNKKVLEQMEFLSEKYNLKGYKYTDLEYFISLYNEYYFYIIIYILAAAFTFFLYISLKKFRTKKLGVRPYLFIAILMFVYYITNYRVIPSRAIIANNNSLLMSAPSAAGELVALCTAGHRVSIHEKSDIWYQITWENGRAYIKQSDLFLIPDNQKSLF